MTDRNHLILGVDGGGTQSRARLCAYSGRLLGEAVSGPANLRLGIEASFSSVLDAAGQCLANAGIGEKGLARVVACLALAGASEPGHLDAAKRHRHPFRAAIITTDAHAACIGAHGGRDGGVIVAGTGAVAWALLKGKTYRFGGWGLPISDEGSGSWVGSEALRRVLWAHDGRIAWTPLLRALFADLSNDPHAIVGWTAGASPREFGAFAPRVADFARHDDPVAIELMRAAAAHIDALAARLIALGVPRLALVGGFSGAVETWLAKQTTSRLLEPIGDAVQGAVTLARSAAQSLKHVA
ncbi:MAG: BadF/BadG/BcrA/BcrD ATPase family protein [Xanthobacteraceae bacterium]